MNTFVKTFQYAVWYEGMIIDYLRARNDEEANVLAHKLWTGNVTAKRM